MNRRELVKLSAGAAVASALPASDQRFGPVLAFAKHLQWLSFDEVAVFLEENDLDGIEATVRKGGQVEPEQVERDLPLLVRALEKRGRSVGMITTGINDADNALSRRVIKTADSLGIKWFRMAYYRYDFERPILAQLDEHRQTVEMKMQGYSHEEIGDRLGLSVRTVNRRLQLVRRIWTEIAGE